MWYQRDIVLSWKICLFRILHSSENPSEVLFTTRTWRETKVAAQRREKGRKKQAGIEWFVIVKKKRQYASFFFLPCCYLIFLFWSASLFTSGLHDRKSERRVLPVWTLVNTLEAWENVKAQLWSECCKWSGDSFSAWVCLCTFVCAWGERVREM